MISETPEKYRISNASSHHQGRINVLFTLETLFPSGIIPCLYTSAHVFFLYRPHSPSCSKGSAQDLHRQPVAPPGTQQTRKLLVARLGPKKTLVDTNPQNAPRNLAHRRQGPSRNCCCNQFPTSQQDPSSGPLSPNEQTTGIYIRLPFS